MFTRSQRTLARGLMGIMGTILVLMGGSLYGLEVSSELATLDDWVYRKARLLAPSIRYPLPLSPTGTIRESLPADLDLESVPRLGQRIPSSDSDFIYVRWYDSAGHLRRFSGSVPPALLPHPILEVGFTTREDANNDNVIQVRQLTLPIMHQTQTLGYLQVATPLAPVAETLWWSRLGFSLTLPLGVGLISLVSWGFGGLAIRPIRRSHQALERFTSNASHELRSPIAAILNNAEVGLMATDVREQQGRLQRIADLSQSLAGLLNSLLLLARTQGEDPLPWRQPINITHLVRRLDAEYRDRATAVDLHWGAALPAEPWVVQGHDELLSLALGNLLSNACRYTPAGGKVMLTLMPASEHVIITVADTGIGIAPEDLLHIFDRFYRVDNVRSPQEGGFGLGLAIAQHIITAHNGTIQVQSHVGKGSSFTVTLPLS